MIKYHQHHHHVTPLICHHVTLIRYMDHHLHHDNPLLYIDHHHHHVNPILFMYIITSYF